MKTREKMTIFRDLLYSKLSNMNKPYCHFCGSTVGQISERTGDNVNAIYDCQKCMRNYCDQCSYGKEIEGQSVQFCLRCDNRIEQIGKSVV
jgi:hypothetical protein